MTTWTAPFADGWKAEQNARGDLGCGGGGTPTGAPIVRVLLRGPTDYIQVFATPGRPVGWLDEGRFLYIPLNSTDLWVWSLASGSDLFAARGGGNTTCAADDHWLSVTVFSDATGTVQYDGGTLYAGALYDGGAVAGRRAVHVVPGGRDGAPYVQEYLDRQPTRLVPLPENALTLQADGWIGAGYFGESWVLRPGATVFDLVTVTPWRQEGPPTVVIAPDGTPWLWTATSSPGGRSLVLGRPDGQQDCIVVDLVAARLQVRVLDGQWSIVAVDGGGQLRTTTVPLDASRVPVPRDVILPPAPPPPIPNPPKPPEKPPMSFSMQQAADLVSAFPFDIYVDALERYRRQVWVRDQGGDVPSRGAMAYFDSRFFGSILTEIVRRNRLPGGPTPDAFAADYNALASLGVQTAITAYKREQGPGPEDPQ